MSMNIYFEVNRIVHVGGSKKPPGPGFQFESRCGLKFPTVAVLPVANPDQNKLCGNCSIYLPKRTTEAEPDYLPA